MCFAVNDTQIRENTPTAMTAGLLIIPTRLSHYRVFE